MTKNKFIIAGTCEILCICFFVVTGCNVRLPESFDTVDLPPQIYPDYIGVDIPLNIAPMNFIIREPGSDFRTEISAANGAAIVIAGQHVDIPIAPWKKLLDNNCGADIRFTVFAKDPKTKIWKKFSAFNNRISQDPIDPYLAYRLIDPGYEMFGNITLNERCLENFEKRSFFRNDLFGEKSCANCHCFQNGKATNAIVHIRYDRDSGMPSGTIVYQNGKISKVNLRPDPQKLPCVYPAWHPKLPILAFSSNDVGQGFHTIGEDKVSVFDRYGDLSLYDVENNTLSPIFETPDSIESFPNWSPDGKFLYYVEALSPELLPQNKDVLQYGKKAAVFLFKDYHYNLMRVPFDLHNQQFGKPELIVDAVKLNKSVTFPRISPDGRYMLYCLTDYGCFSIWYRASDLYLLDLQTNENRPLTEINSGAAESFHNWTADGKWIVFTSRRDDGGFTRLYFAHFADGKCSKPFLLPQRDPNSNLRLFKSYNVPELLSEPVPFHLFEFVDAVNTKPVNATWLPKNNVK
jgi:hypothetical protein